MEAVVLCGGMASRLGAITRQIPKSLLPVRGRPFLEWQLRALARQGIDRVTLATGHLGDRIEERLGDGSGLGVTLAYSREAQPLGTAGALRLATKNLADWPVLALNGDSYCHFDVNLMQATHRRAQAEATIWLVPGRSGGGYGSLEVNTDGRITSFIEKSSRDTAWVSAGVYLVGSVALEGVEVGAVASIEHDVFPRLADGRLVGVKGSGRLLDIGTPERYMEADAALTQLVGTDMKESDGAAVDLISQHLAGTSALQQRVAKECCTQITSAAKLIVSAFVTGGKLLLCGNGGSAASCQHMAAEFTNRLSPNVHRRGLPAIALTTDTSFLTAFGNDYGFEQVFARQVEALGRPGDVLLGISTSGRSRNVLAAFAAATRQGIATICLSGLGGDAENLADCAVVIPSSDTMLIQEAMLPVEHLICQLVERDVLSDLPR